MEKYEPHKIEEEILQFWDKNKTYSKLKAKLKGQKKYYFLDGPPYTSGRIHLGQAWNKSLKDMIIRYKRMNGLDVFDRTGFDMHGLPTEQKVMQELKFTNKDQILEMGVDKFVQKCKDFSLTQMNFMIKDFHRIGIWMDFSNPYMPIKNEFISGEWWLIKKAHEQGRLYEGFRTIAWDYVHQTALAKHELEYQTVTDKSIFVKFKVKSKNKSNDNEYLVIWTTTPWTIPFNLGIMVNPELEYMRMKVGSEIWIMSKGLGPTVILSLCGKKYEALDEFKGDKLEGMEYIHPFHDSLGNHYYKLKTDHPKVHTVIMSEEYVDLSAGTGLVHMAPGCGPEDYEIGHKNNIPAWNVLLENGDYPEGMGEFSGKNAKVDNDFFTEMLKKRDNIIAETEVEHEYPFGQRSHAPIIFRATKQWFFKIEDIKEDLIRENDKILWQPQAAYNAFNSWLRNLRDNSITKQRFWGTPVPIWRNEKNPDDIIVVGSIAELEELCGQKILDAHKPWIDDVIIEKDGKIFRRIPDILDVWVDAGTAAWNCLDFPEREDLFKDYYPADFILEGKDQIRGWFNLLHIASMLGMKRPAFKACYMHGFINDAQGRKMSKSLGNIVSPYEVIDKYGADTLRYYMIGDSKAAIDINYNFGDMDVRNKNLSVLWNVHNYLIDIASVNNIKKINLDMHKHYSKEEQYILSRLNSTIKKVTGLLEEYRLDEVPRPIEDLYLDLSRKYIQLTRDKSSTGTTEEKHVVIEMIYHVLFESVKMLSIVTPFITEKIYQNLKDTFQLSEESIHFFSWPKYDESLIDAKLEKSFDLSFTVMQSILFAREKINTGVRWPLSEATIVTNDDEVREAITLLDEVLKTQTNIKKISVHHSMPSVKNKVRADFKQLGPDFGPLSPKIIAELAKESSDAVLTGIAKSEKFELKVDGKIIALVKEHLIVERIIPENLVEVEFTKGIIYLNKDMTDDLLTEGFARELMRRVQSLRKNAGLNKKDRIDLFVKTDSDLITKLNSWERQIIEKVGAEMITISTSGPNKSYSHISKEKVKNKEFEIFLEKL